MNTNIKIAKIPNRRSFIEFIWDWNQKGYGELSIDIIDGNIIIWNENLSKEEVRQLLYSFSDHIIEHGNFKEFRED